MPNPTKYERDYSFSDFQSNNPSSPLPAPPLDNELENIEAAISGTIDAIKDVRRADGALKNGIVTLDSLHTAVAAGVGAGALEARDEAVAARDFSSQWASGPDGVPVDDGVNPPDFSAKHYAAVAENAAAGALPNGSVTTPKLANEAVTTPKLADEAVTLAKVDPEVLDQANHVDFTAGDVASKTIPAAVMSFRTSGYAAPGDGGGARYRRVDTEPAHPGKLQSDDGAWWEYAETEGNLLAFGANPDGDIGDPSTDSEDAFVDAVAWAAAQGGATLRVPRGTYVKGSTGILVDNIRILGEGKGVTTVILRSNTEANNGPVFRFGGVLGSGTSYPIRNCEIGCMTIDGNRANQKNGDGSSDGSNNAIWTRSSLGVNYYHDLEIKDTDGYGISQVGSDVSPRQDLIYERIEISGTAYDGIDTKAGINRITIRNMKVTNCGGGQRQPLMGNIAGIDLRGNDIRIHDCHVDNVQVGGSNGACLRVRSNAGVPAANVTDPRQGWLFISNSSFKGGADDVVRISGPQLGRVAMVNVEVHGGDQAGIHINGGKHVDLTNVYVHGDPGVGEGIWIRDNAEFPIATVNIKGGGIFRARAYGVRNSGNNTILTMDGVIVEACGDGVWASGNSGFHATGCTIRNSGRRAGGSANPTGINLSGLNGYQWSIENCDIYDGASVGNKTQQYAISIGNNARPGRIANNRISGNGVGPFGNGGFIPSGTRVSTNNGYTTYARLVGSRVVDASPGTVATTIAHGFGRTPNSACVSVTARRNTAVNDYELTTLRVQSTNATNVVVSSRCPTTSSTSGATVDMVVTIDETITP